MGQRKQSKTKALKGSMRPLTIAWFVVCLVLVEAKSTGKISSRTHGRHRRATADEECANPMSSAKCRNQAKTARIQSEYTRKFGPSKAQQEAEAKKKAEQERKRKETGEIKRYKEAERNAASNNAAMTNN